MHGLGDPGTVTLLRRPAARPLAPTRLNEQMQHPFPRRSESAGAEAAGGEACCARTTTDAAEGESL